MQGGEAHFVYGEEVILAIVPMVCVKASFLPKGVCVYVCVCVCVCVWRYAAATRPLCPPPMMIASLFRPLLGSVRELRVLGSGCRV